MLEQMVLHASQVIRATSTQDLDPLPLTSNDYPSVLAHEMYALEPGDIPSRILSWKALGFLSHVKRRSNDDRFPIDLGGMVLLSAWGTNTRIDWASSAVSL
jgi:hypothetical protein